MGGDGQTVLNFEGTGTTKFFLAGLFQFNLEGTGTPIFLDDCFELGGDRQTVD